MGIILDQSFFMRPTISVAKDLLGRKICRQFSENICIEKIVTDVEVYDGFEDKASHGYKPKSLRNSMMFGPGGYWYVYLCYGMHWMLNIVTREEGYPAAILIRGVGGIVGPGRLTKVLGIDNTFNGLLANRKNRLWLEDGMDSKKYSIQSTTRIGVAYAGPVWANKKYRFFIDYMER